MVQAEVAAKAQERLATQLTAQRQALSLETSEHIASALKDHNLDVASQVSTRTHIVMGKCLHGWQ